MYVEYKRKAIAKIKSADKSKEYGIVYFTDNGDSTEIRIVLNGLNIYNSDGDNIHAIHIHEFNNDVKCCNELGGHYNPFNEEHGDRLSKNRHVGDLGNIELINGSCDIVFNDEYVKLSGPYSVINRSIIIHKDKDDLGLGGHIDSKTTGHAGERIAFGIIEEK